MPIWLNQTPNNSVAKCACLLLICSFCNINMSYAADTQVLQLAAFIPDEQAKQEKKQVEQKRLAQEKRKKAELKRLSEQKRKKLKSKLPIVEKNTTDEKLTDKDAVNVQSPEELGLAKSHQEQQTQLNKDASSESSRKCIRFRGSCFFGD